MGKAKTPTSPTKAGASSAAASRPRATAGSASSSNNNKASAAAAAAAAASTDNADEGDKGHPRAPRLPRRKGFRVTAEGVARFSVISLLIIATLQAVNYLDADSQVAKRTGLHPRAVVTTEKPRTYYQTPDEQAQYENLVKIMTEHMHADASGANQQHQSAGAGASGGAPIERRAAGDPYDSYYSTSKIAPWYACDPAVCKLPSCQCASTSPPGGLAPAQIPQFVTFTLDDAVNAVVYDLPHQAMRGIRSADGCAMKATYFVSAQWTDFHSLQTLAGSGHEIAGHTFTHNFPTVKEISAMREATEAFGGIPQSSIRGFRAPYLNYTLESLTNLKALNFEYDSTMTLDNAGASTIWPFTFDYGVPVSCATGDCTAAKPTAAVPKPTWRAPGLWELPMYNLMTTDGGVWSMDPAVNTTEFAAMLRKSFNDHYTGNKAPFGVFLHPAYLLADPARVTVLNDFFAEFMARPDVRFVTNQQLLAWLRNPVPLSSMAPLCTAAPAASATAPEVCDGIDNNANGVADEGVAKSCQFGTSNFATCKTCPVRAPTADEPVPPLIASAGAAASTCQPPLGGCVYGSFNAATCMCDCTGSDDPNGSGACRNTLGACTTLRMPDADRPGFFLSCAQSAEIQAKKASTTTTSTKAATATGSSTSQSTDSPKSTAAAIKSTSAAAGGAGPSVLAVALALVVALAAGLF
ncbi:hypothetical protein H9P43_000392 [Blastocladiella emersonii ATCC 22665]|nr:hypothetical protein H9P43_000392 [Blastocladiella emersonii ATCC 22665]